MCVYRNKSTDITFSYTKLYTILLLKKDLTFFVPSPNAAMFIGRSFAFLHKHTHSFGCTQCVYVYLQTQRSINDARANLRVPY